MRYCDQVEDIQVFLDAVALFRNFFRHEEEMDLGTAVNSLFVAVFVPMLPVDGSPPSVRASRPDSPGDSQEEGHANAMRASEMMASSGFGIAISSRASFVLPQTFQRSTPRTRSSRV
jgi:hypothetical protein